MPSALNAGLTGEEEVENWYRTRTDPWEEHLVEQCNQHMHMSSVPYLHHISLWWPGP